MGNLVWCKYLSYLVFPGGLYTFIKETHKFGHLWSSGNHHKYTKSKEGHVLDKCGQLEFPLTTRSRVLRRTFIWFRYLRSERILLNYTKGKQSYDFDTYGYF